jgi:hypothetical protein
VDFNAFFRLLAMAFAGDDKRAVVELDLDVLAFQSGQFDADGKIVLVFLHVERGSPNAQGRFKQPVQFVLQVCQPTVAD